MGARLGALKALGALLYIGPLAAGLGGLGLNIIPLFVAIFVVWLMVLRPEQWPSTPAEWLTANAWGAALTQVLSQTLLVAVLLAVGRGLGAVTSLPPGMNPMFPLGLSFLAIPLCRLMWDSGEAAKAGVFLDAEAEAAHAPRTLADAARAVVPLLNMADDMADSLAADAVTRVMTPIGAELRLKALAAALAHPDRSHSALRRALVLWATEPEIVASGQVPSAMSAAFEVAGRNADLLRIYVSRALALIAAFPDRVGGFPSPQAIGSVVEAGFADHPDQDLPAHLKADLRKGMLALAQAVEKATNAQDAKAKADPVMEPKTQTA